jgi:hypothetical protein
MESDRTEAKNTSNNAIAATAFRRVTFASLLASVVLCLLPDLLAGRDGPQEEMRVPLTEGRWCPASPLIPDTGGPLSPNDMHSPIKRNPTFIVGLSVLRVDTRFEETDCNDDCRQRVSRILAQSLNIWRHLCLRCGSGLLAFLIDGPWVYIDANVFAAWKQQAGSMSERLLNAYAAVLRLDGTTPSGAGHVLGTYIRIHTDHPLLREICENNLGAFQSQWPGRLKAAACLTDATSVPTLAIRFTPASVCGGNSYLGCATHQKGVEITTSRRYVESTRPSYALEANEFVIGRSQARPSIDLHAVLLHETGHFLGLDHLPTKFLPRTNLYPVMLDAYYPEFCASITEASMFNSAADADWKYLAKPCSGLKGPRK